MTETRRRFGALSGNPPPEICQNGSAWINLLDQKDFGTTDGKK
jgi:hypothetical protein